MLMLPIVHRLIKYDTTRHDTIKLDWNRLDQEPTQKCNRLK